MGDGTQKKTILAVDDVSMNLMIIKKLLSGSFEVRVAKSGELALHILNSVPVDLILLDIEMPVMSGIEFLALVREIPGVKDIPVICVTSHVGDEVIKKALEAGAKDCLHKPLDGDLLRKKVFLALKEPL